MNAASRAGGGELNLGTLFVSALELYGRTLNMWDVGISVRGELGGYYTKESRGWVDKKSPFLLSVESPIDTTQDVGRGAWGIQKARRAFAAAHCSLSRAVRAWGAHTVGSHSLQDPAAAAASSGSGREAGGAPSSSSSSSSSLPTPSAAGVGGQRVSAFGQVVSSSAPRSLLGCVIRVDDLLRLRKEELVSQMEEAKGAAEEGGGSEGRAGKESGGAEGGGSSRAADGASASASPAAATEEEVPGVAAQEVGSAPAGPPPPSEQPPGGDAERVRAAAYSRLNALAGEGTDGEVILRHKRLLSDILTRKQRGIPAVIAAPNGWY